MKINYLNNKDILKEIHKSKTSYCVFTLPEYSEYDVIVNHVNEIPKLFKESIEITEEIDSLTGTKSKISTSIPPKALTARAIRLTKASQEIELLAGKKPKSDLFAVDWTEIKEDDVIFRVMTWEHVPLDDTKKGKKVADYIDDASSEYDLIDDPVDPKFKKYTRCNFPPFMHYKMTNGELELVGKSHWKGALRDGSFDKERGAMTNKLAHMFIKLCERYATRSNWRGYCVDSTTEALTNRGWLGIDQITENDSIVSYTDGDLKWSGIKSIYRGQYNGLMHHITSRSIDSLITPKHKIVTARGLVEVELLKQSDQVIVMGKAIAAPEVQAHTNEFVELAGWIMTEGSYQYDKPGEIKSIEIYQNPTAKADRIRNCLTALGYKFTESGSKNLCFRIWKEYAEKFVKTFPVKNLSMDFILTLTSGQRDLLISTMVDGDGWRRGNNMSYCQKDKEHVDLFQALLTLAGKKSNYHYVVDHPSFGKLVNFYSINIFSKRGNKTRGECLDFNGGLNNGSGMNRNLGKETFPNAPTVQYNGMVWCPETEYGCFVARRNGKVYLTGNTYNDEMRAQALLQLSQIGLRFDESKSDNPFAYFTATITNSFCRVLNIEKRNQNIRDDILELAGLNPSYTRQGMSSGGGGYDD